VEKHREEEEWVLVEKQEEEEKQFFVSSVAHSVPLTVPEGGPSFLSHTLTNSPVNIGASFLVHQTVAPPHSKAITTSTQTYKPRLAAFLPLFGNANVNKKEKEEEEEEVVILAHYCNGQKIKIENEAQQPQTYRPRSKALVPLFGNVDGQKIEKDEEVTILAHYCNGKEIKLERNEETSKMTVEDNLRETTQEKAHYYNGQYIKQEEEAKTKRSICNSNEKNEQTDDDAEIVAHYYNGQRIKDEETVDCQSYTPRHKALVPLFGGGCSGEKRKRDDEVVVVAHYYRGQQIKQEEQVDFHSFTSRNEALDTEGEDDEVVVVAHYYNGHQMAPLFEEKENEDDVVVLAHYQNGRQIESSHPAFVPFIGPLEEEKDDSGEEVVVLAHYYNGQQIKQESPSHKIFHPFIGPLEEEKEDSGEEVVVLAHYFNGQQIKQEGPSHKTFQPFIGPLEEGESHRFAPKHENLVPSFENLSQPKYQEDVEDDKEDVVLLAHYHKGQRIDRIPHQSWSPARALKFSGKPLALTGPSKLALTYQEPTGIIDFLLDCLPFPEEEDEEEETRGEEEPIPLPFSPNLAHTTDVTQVSLDLLSPRTDSPTHKPFPPVSPSLVEEDEEEELEMCSYRRRKRMGRGGSRRCNHPMRYLL